MIFAETPAVIYTCVLSLFQAQFADPGMSYYSDTVNPTNDLVGAMDNDMTFAPQCASTCRFAFQASSTPFNPMDHANLKPLPISAIKQEIFSFDKHMENNKSSGSILTHKIAEVTNDTQYNTENTSNQSQNTVNKTAPTAGDATMQHRKSYANLRYVDILCYIDQFHVVRYCFLNNALSLYGSYDCT